MDGSAFDTFTRLASNASTRRGAVRAAIGGSVASAAAAIGFVSLAGDAGAKKKCKKKKCPKCESLTFGARCTSNLQCCTNETNMACLTVNGAGNSDRTCCGSLGFPCTELNDCCQQYNCVNGTCQPDFPI